MKHSEIDEQFRSVLFNAEEEVPAGLWDAISAKMDMQPAQKPVFTLYKKVVFTIIGMCAAAAVAVGVFLTGTQKTSGPEIQVVAPSGQQVLADADEICEPLGTGGSEPIVSAAQIINDRQAVQSEILGSPQQTVMSENPETEIQDVASSQTESEDIMEEIADNGLHAQSAEESEKENQQEAMQKEDESDYFAAAQWEDEHRTRQAGRLSLSLNGLVQSNGDPSSLGKNGNFTGPTAAPRKTTITQISKESTYSVPLSFGLGVTYSFTPRWAMGIGLNYSLLNRSFTGQYTKVSNGVVEKTITSDIHNSLHYIGIPVNAYYTIIPSKRIHFYTYAGLTVEKGIRSSFRVNTSGKDILHNEAVKGVQVSTAIGLGVSFRLVEDFSLYIDPSLRYYFDCNQPVSIRTQQPLMLGFEIGFRMNL